MSALEANLFTRLTLGSVYSRTFSVFFAHKNVFLAISAIACVPLFAMLYTTNSVMMSVQETIIEGMKDGTYEDVMQAQIAMSTMVGTQIHNSLAKLMAENLFYMLVGILVQSAMALAVAQIYIAKTPSVKVCLEVALSKYCTVFGAGWVVGAIVTFFYALAAGGIALCFMTESGFLKFVGFLVTVAVVIVVVYITVAMMLLPSVIMIEGKGVMNSIKRCWELASGNRCFIYCTMFWMAFFQGFVQGFVSQLLGGEHNALLGTTISIAVALFFLPMITIISTVVYLHIRVQHEGLNCKVLEGDLGCRNNVAYAVLDADEEDVMKSAKEPLTQTV